MALFLPESGFGMGFAISNGENCSAVPDQSGAPE